MGSKGLSALGGSRAEPWPSVCPRPGLPLSSGACFTAPGSRRTVMMYFSRLKTWLVVGTCLLGALLCLPNLLPAPAGWLPWRSIHLGLDLRGGSYLLLEVDMNAVIRERLDSLADAARTGLRRAGVVRFLVTPQLAQDRLTVRIDEADKQAAANAALRELITANSPAGNRPDLELATGADGNFTVTLSTIALKERATAAVQQSIEIVRRRIDETGVVDPQITRQGETRIVVQLPGIEDPNRIKELLGKTARMTFRMVAEDVNPNVGGAAARGGFPGRRELPGQQDRGAPARRRGRRQPDRRAGRAELADRRVGGQFRLRLDRQPPFR